MGCRNKTKLERRLILFTAVLCGVALILFIILLSGHGQKGDICYSPECIRAASHILDTVDPAVDPCHDFYKFACGSFFKNAFALGQPTTLHNYLIMMINRMKEIVIENDDKRNISRGLQMQKKFYRTCINDTAIDADNDTTFLNLLNNITGGWPVVKENWSGENFNWTTAMVEARKLGFFYQFFFRVDVFKNDTPNTIWIRPPNKNDIESFYWTDQNRPLMVQIASDLGGQSRDMFGDIGFTIKFAENLNLIIQEYYNNTKENEEYDRRNSTIKHLKHSRFDINWLEFLKNLTGVDVTVDDLVIFDVDNYFEELYLLLRTTQKKIQANYMAWVIISTNIQYMTKKVREKHIKMRNQSSAKSRFSRSDLCYRISGELFKNVVDGEYIRRYTSLSKREYIGEMIKNIKSELQSVLENVSWMDEETKSYAMQRLKNITEEIGGGELVYDADKFESFFGYDKIEITSDKLVDMARLMNIHAVNQHYRRIRQTPLELNEEKINTPKLGVNAYFMKYFGKLRVVLGTPILEGNVIDERRPHSMNYGSLGSIIGHEFMHGFIEHSSNEEEDENIWWTNKTIKNFKKVSQCLINDYDRYPEKIGINESDTVLEENVADFSGVNLAYTAYRKSTRRNKVDEKLPGIRYTPDQLFWIMTSTYLCYEPKQLEMDKSMWKKLVHAAPSYRVIGRLQNSPHFAEAFNCPVGSPMNPKNKCRIFA